jgi:hypothetical protein
MVSIESSTTFSSQKVPYVEFPESNINTYVIEINTKELLHINLQRTNLRDYGLLMSQIILEQLPFSNRIKTAIQSERALLSQLHKKDPLHIKSNYCSSSFYFPNTQYQHSHEQYQSALVEFRKKGYVNPYDFMQPPALHSNIIINGIRGATPTRMKSTVQSIGIVAVYTNLDQRLNDYVEQSMSPKRREIYWPNRLLGILKIHYVGNPLVKFPQSEKIFQLKTA